MPDHGTQQKLAEALEGRQVDLRDAIRLRGVVVEVGDGVAQVVGLRNVGSEELVAFDSGAYGMAYDLAPTRTGVVLLKQAEKVRAGDGVQPVDRLPSIPTGPEMLGRVVNPFGDPMDDRPAPSGQARAVFQSAPKLIQRSPVRRPLHTGIMAIDAAIPIGRGQRQLIVGDRNVGKTALALDVVAAQRFSDVICVYVVIGQPLSRVLAIRDALKKSDALDHTVVVAGDAAEAPGLQYLAPYAGTTIAESIAEAGRDVLVVYDDLTKHADAYRELALLMGRPPGREAFPGDIFYIHAELLERATAFSSQAGGGSVTAFPVVETTDNDIAAYIPTNLISITDGQIYLDSTLFERNQRPAIDIKRSVSRIGGAAQIDIMRKVARNLRIDMARFESLETLTRVGLDVDPRTRSTIERGRILRQLLRQPRFTVRSVAGQILAITAVAEGWVEGMTPEEASERIWDLVAQSKEDHPELMAALDGGEDVPDDWKERAQAIFAKDKDQAES